jgi:hypothetical protein
MHLVFLLLVSVIPIMLINIIGTIIPFLFVLKILLPPFQVGCLASLYIDQFKQEETTADSPVDGEPDTKTTVLLSLNTERELAAGANEEESKANESGTPDMITTEEKTADSSEEKEDEQEKD